MRVPIAEEKKTGPACIIIFLGLEIDTLEMVKRIPQDKLVEVGHKLHMVLNKKKVTLKEYIHCWVDQFLHKSHSICTYI
jgi:hypothetical protein